MKTSASQLTIQDQEHFDSWLYEQLQLPKDFENLSITEKMELISTAVMYLTKFAQSLGNTRSNFFFFKCVSHLSEMGEIFATQHGEKYLSENLFSDLDEFTD